jgi:hypothetical protein
MPIPKENQKLFSDFCIFSKKQLASWDIDPMYPLLKNYYRAKSLSWNEALWHTALYVGLYNIGSAAQCWKMFPKQKHIPAGTMPQMQTGTERRLFRGRINDFVTCMNDMNKRSNGNLSSWVSKTASQGGERGWADARKQFESIKFNGPWASYKWADLLKQVHDYPITASDIGVGGGSKSAGPVAGMEKLTGRPWKECAEDIGLQKELYRVSIRAGVPFNGLDQLETALCDFNSLYKGRYYPGHDIDMQMEHLAYCDASLWEARAKAIPLEYRGEVVGWFGVRKELLAKYRDENVIV